MDLQESREVIRQVDEEMAGALWWRIRNCVLST